MEKEINITQKLVKLVKDRNTPVIVNKQENSFIRNKKSIKSLAYESYSYDFDD